MPEGFHSALFGDFEDSALCSCSFLSTKITVVLNIHSHVRLYKNGAGLSLTKDVIGADAACTAELLESALRQLNLLRQNETFIGYEDMGDWVRGGAETYVASGQVTLSVSAELKVRRFVAKAAVTFPLDPERAVEQWVERLNLLRGLGVRCPESYSVCKGILYQELLPDTLETYWKGANTAGQHALSLQLVEIAAVLDACGFQPISFVNDLLLRDGLVYLVDVGSDLGTWDFSNPSSTSRLRLERSGFVLPNSLDEVGTKYESRFALTRTAITVGQIASTT